MSNIFTLNWKDVSGAVISAMLIAVLGYLGTLSNVMTASPSAILNVAVLTGITSLLKALGTDSSGHFLGAVRVK